MKRRERLKPIVERIGLPFVTVNSNVSTFYQGWRFQATHTPRNTSVALLLQQGIGRFLYVSTYSYSDIYVDKTDDIAHADPVILPLLLTTELDVLAVGSEYTRPEKALQVAEIPDSYRVLDVCIRQSSVGNCSRCEKCQRTLLTLEIAGLLERYEDVFDLGAYRRAREVYCEGDSEQQSVCPGDRFLCPGS